MTYMKELGEVVEDAMLPVTLFSITGLLVGQ